MQERFKAFLSYASEDALTARRLHKHLEHFARRHWWALRARRIFLDSSALPTSPDLWGQIEAALDASDFFVLLASPRAAQASGVEKEVAWWLAHKGSERLLIALIDGAMVWDETRSAFGDESAEKATRSVPKSLRGTLPKEPKWTVIPKLDEPRAEKRDDFKSAIASLVSGLEGMPKDHLLARHASQRRRLVLAGTTLAALSLAGLTAAYLQSLRATRALEVQVALDLAGNASVESAEVNQIERSALLALESMRRVPLPENDAALRQALRLLPKSVARLKHAHRVSSVALSPDQRLFATGSGDGATRVFELPAATQIAEFRQKAQVFGLAFTSDGTTVVASSGDNSVRAFDARSGLERWAVHLASRGVALRATDGIIAAGSEGGELVMLTSSGQELWRVTLGGFVGSLSFNANGSALAVTGGSPLRVLETTRGQLVWADQLGSNSATFSPRGDRLAIGSKSGVRVLETTKWTTVAQRDGNPYERVAYSPDGSRLATVGTDGVIRVWDSSLKERARFSLGAPTAPTWLEFSQDGSKVWVASFDKTVRAIDAATGLELRRVGHDGFVLAGATTSDGRYVITGGDDGVARVNALSNEGCVALPGSGPLMVPLTVSPDGRSAVGVRSDKVLRVVSVDSGTEIQQWKLEGEPSALKYLPDGVHAIVAIKEHGLRLLNLQTGDIIWKRPVDAEVDALDVSSSGESVAFGTWSGTLQSLRAMTGEEHWSQRLRGPILAVAFSENGGRLATSGAEALVLNAKSGETVWRRPPSGATSAAALNGAGDLVAFALSDNSVQVTRVSDGADILRLPNLGTVVSLAFSPSSRLLALGGSEKVARVFELAEAKELARIPVGDNVWKLLFPAEDAVSVTVGFERVERHTIDRESLFAATCSRVTRNLTSRLLKYEES